jgi:hypothetical protein
MEGLLDIANRLIDKTGLTATEHFDHVDLTINGDKIGSLAYDASNTPYYYSIPTREVVTGSLDEIGDRIMSDLDSQFELVPVDSKMYEKQLSTSSDSGFNSVIESISIPALKSAILGAYRQYKSA